MLSPTRLAVPFMLLWLCNIDNKKAACVYSSLYSYVVGHLVLADYYTLLTAFSDASISVMQSGSKTT